MSTESKPPVEELSRGELEERVESLEDDVEAFEQASAAVAKLVNELTDLPEEERVGFHDPDFIAQAAQAFGDLTDQLNQHEQTLKRVDSTVQESRSATGSTDDEHWWNVVEAAHRVKTDHEHAMRGEWVRLYRENIAQATGLSKKRGQQLIDEWSAEESNRHKRGTKKQCYEPATPANNNSVQRKALRIDLGVWEEAE